jgi:glycine hydroxymethyltransferase
MLWDLRPHGVTSTNAVKLFDKVNITTNKQGFLGDASPLNPGGVRLGTPAVTTRGMKEPEMEIIAEFLVKGIAIAKRI